MPNIPSWSHSKLSDFEKCKYRSFLLHIEKAEEPQRPLPPGKTELANDRGTRIHQGCEDYVRGLIDKMPAEAAKHFELEMVKMRELFAAGMVTLEGEWGMSRNWEPWDWRGQWVEMTQDIAKIAAEKVKALPERPKTGTVYQVGKKFWTFVPPWLRLKLDSLVFVSKYEAIAIDYKGLPLDTPLPTPTGWTTMGSIQVGDKLLDRNGEVCNITGKSTVKHLPCYRITFDDTSVAVCDEEHRWVLVDGSVKEAKYLEAGELLPVAEATKLPTADLVIDPYVLGVWLADGKHTSGEITKPDQFIWEEIQRRGYEISHDYNATNGKCRVSTVKGLRGQLGSLGLLGAKTIPPAYLRASFEQRLDLLRGLMDGDGSANHTRKQAVLNTVDERFAQQVKELLLSLGQRPLVSPYIAEGFDKYVQAYFVSFRPRGINPFSLPRKADKVLADWGPGESWRRKITKIEKIESVPTQCIMVDSPDHTFLCTSNFLPTHNTGKRFGNEIKHGEQLQLYQLVTFMRYPELEKVTTELWYFDVDDLAQKTFTRDQGLRFRPSWDKRGNALTTCEVFPPNGNVHSCRWCMFGERPGGSGICKAGKF